MFGTVYYSFRPCSAYPIFGLFGFFFQSKQYFSLTTIQPEQCFSASFSQVSDQRTGSACGSLPQIISFPAARTSPVGWEPPVTSALSSLTFTVNRGRKESAPSKHGRCPTKTKLARSKPQHGPRVSDGWQKGVREWKATGARGKKF